MRDPAEFPPLESLPYCKGDCGTRLRPAGTTKQSTWRRRFPTTIAEYKDGYCYRDYSNHAAGHDPKAPLPDHYVAWLRDRNARLEKDRKNSAAPHAPNQKVDQ